MSYQSPEYTRSESTRTAQAVWHDVLTELSKAERIFRSIGHRKEADQIFAYACTLTQHAEYHLKRLVSQNGHSKDSQGLADGVSPADSPENHSATVDVGVASKGLGHDHTESFPETSDDVAEAPSSGIVLKHFDLSLVEEIELWMTQVRAMASGSQLKECALSFGSRALDLARRNHQTARERFEAAQRVLHGSEAEAV